MENYQLQENEVILYHGIAALSPDGKLLDDVNAKNVAAEVVLTNENFVFVRKVKRFLKKEEVYVEVYSITDVKWYKDTPHILKKGKLTELYFKTAERFVQFSSIKEARTFADTALRLVSGKSKLVRAVKKARKEIEETDEQLDIDIIGTTKKVAGVVTDVAVTLLPSTNKATRVLGALAKVLKQNKDEKRNQLPEATETRTSNQDEA